MNSLDSTVFSCRAGPKVWPELHSLGPLVAEVIADNYYTRKLIREIYRPYARPSAHIKNMLRVLCNGCTEEHPVKYEPEYVVFKI
jgi:hypothetical protein